MLVTPITASPSIGSTFYGVGSQSTTIVAQTTTGHVTVALDLVNMAAGDTLTVQLRRTVSGTLRNWGAPITRAGAQSEPILVLDLGLVEVGWEVAVKCSSSRTIPTIITRDDLAVDKIMAALKTWIPDTLGGSVTFQGIVAALQSYLGGGWTGTNTGTAVGKAADGTTTRISKAHDPTAGTITQASTFRVD